MRRAILIVLAVLVLMAVFQIGVAVGQNKYGTPQTVLHVVAGKWKAEATPEQRQQAIEGIQTMAAKVPGIKNVWLKTDRVQPREYHYAFAIEFESRAAADAYAEHPAHDEWYKVYIPLREESRSLQVTNP
ncbi:MAG: Dabb family protein [Acidobacteria bacterium]|nr:Dabb family protein [Acidobacteriota bacterium]